MRDMPSRTHLAVRWATCVAVVALLAGCSAPQATGRTPTSAPTDESGPPDVDVSQLGAESLTVEPFADFAMSSGDLVWVSGVDPGIVAYDADMDAVFSVEAGEVWAALEFGHGAIWASEAPTGQRATTLLKIDPATGGATRFSVPEPGIPQESSVAVTDGAVWVIVPGAAPGANGTLVGLDPASGQQIRTIDIGPDTAAAVRGGFGSLWLTRPTGLLERYNPETGASEAQIELALSSTFLSIGPDAVWVMNQLGEVARVDPATDTVVATIDAAPAGIAGGDIVAGDDAVWLQADTRLAVEIDPADDTVVQRLVPAQGSGSIAITDDGAVWITAHDVETLYRIPPR